MKRAMDNRNLAWWGWPGLLLIAVFWYVNWDLPGLRTHYGFFPLWLGYCLVIDAITHLRKGNSLISRNLPGYMLLFVVSAFAWWFFELINAYTNFWHYSERERFSDVAYFLYATLSFSTVIPAVFGTSEFVGTFRFFQRSLTGLRIGKSTAGIRVMFLLGLMMAIAIVLYPQYSAALIWVAPYLILDPVNHYLGNRTLIHGTAQRDWREVMILWAGCLICGFFWEMWNYYSWPKWYYTVPFVDFWYVFEMPVLGYLGYLPFALDLFAFYHLLMGFCSKKWQTYLRLFP